VKIISIMTLTMSVFPFLLGIRRVSDLIK